MEKKCVECGSSRLERAVFGGSAVWLERQSAWSRALKGAPVGATACMDCGHLTLRVDPDELAKLAGE
jgi:hypothetical protein